MAQRERSHWGWGWADRLPDAEARRNLSQLVAAMTGLPTQEPVEPVALDAIRLGAPRPLTLPDGVPASQDDEARARHTYGRAYPDIVRGFYGQFEGAPDVVLWPEDAAQVARALAWAEAEGVAVIPFGGGTSVVGGVNAGEVEGDRPVAALSTRRLNRVLAIDEVSALAHIQAGALGPELEAQLGAQGWTLRHFPQSFEHSTLGGWIATRAGGHFATLHTHIDDLTAAVRMVTPAGALETRRLPASGAGPDPLRMALGSEGVLGVITDAWMRVRPRPRWRVKADVAFARFEDAVAATRAISQSGLHPANCRLLDAREAALNQVRHDGQAVLLLGFESADALDPLLARAERAIAIAESCGGQRDSDPQVREDHPTQSADAASKLWKQAFFDGPYLQSALVSVGVLADTFETAITWDRFEALHADIIATMRRATAEICGHKGLITCRFTHVYPDGPAPYYTYLAPARPGEELAQWAALKAAASEALMRHGATITHHHAVGRTHRPWYTAHERPALFGRMWRAATAAVDPHGIMNPGVLG